MRSVPRCLTTSLAIRTSTESECENGNWTYVSFLFAGDWFKPYHLEVPKILAHGIPILIYAGDADYICKYRLLEYQEFLICSWMGNQAWTDSLEWPGAKKFRAAHLKDFKVNGSGDIAGQYKSAEGLTFMRVRASLTED